MTLGYFPSLYPDELLCSAVARYRVHTMASCISDVNHELFNNRNQFTAIALPRDLENLHIKVGEFIGMTVVELVYRATLYPYYAAFAKRAVRETTLNNMLRSVNKAVDTRGGNLRVKLVKVCPDCLDEDLKSFGEAYWHRIHQLDCVHICEVHVQPLLQVVSRHGNGIPLDPLTANTDIRSYMPYLSEKSRQRLLEVARLARFYLDSSTGWKACPVKSAYPEGFREAYFRGGRNLNKHQMRRDFMDYFGEQCIDILGLRIDVDDKKDWLQQVFNNHQRLSPLKRIAFQIFARDRVPPLAMRVRSKGYINQGASNKLWRCQNPAADHFGKAVVTEVSASNYFKKNDLINFSCSCGYIFQAKASTWDLRSEPNCLNVSKYGSVFVEMVRNLYRAGNRIGTIAQMLEVHRSTVRRMLESNYKNYRVHEDSGAHEASVLMKRLRTSKKIAFKSYRDDYRESDIELAMRVSTAAKLILEKNPPVRVSIKNMIEFAGIDINALFADPFYPQTFCALDSSAEPVNAFLRRVRRQVSR
jgi:hypothetical protein